jgi:hypothetical protein
VGGLKSLLPIEDLKQASHSFDVIGYDGPDPRLKSRITVVGTNPKLWLILAAHQIDLGNYRCTQAEIAFDAPATSVADALNGLYLLIGKLGKRRHQRGFLSSKHKPDRTQPAGKVSSPTFYLEDRKSGVTLKCYVRLEKFPGGGFGDPIVRLEWTLKGKPTLKRHLGGNQIKDLMHADLNAFLERNLCLEQVDHIAFGKLFRGFKITRHSGRGTPTIGGVKEQWNNPDYRAKRAAFLVLRRLAYREQEYGRFASWDQALWACQNSPAQIRGYLRELRNGKRHGRRGRPKLPPRTQKNTITDYKINACFQPIQLPTAPSPV